MKLYVKRKKYDINAIAEYDLASGTFTVLKGSKVSDRIAFGNTFRGAVSIERARGNGVVVEGVCTTDVSFKSASTAANFVTGTSTNGMITWKNEDGKTLKSILAELED